MLLREVVEHDANVLGVSFNVVKPLERASGLGPGRHVKADLASHGLLPGGSGQVRVIEVVCFIK